MTTSSFPSLMKKSLLLVSLPAAHACSAYAAGRLATVDGSVMVSHSDDGDGTSDPRISYIPPATFAPNATRPIWPDLESYPRFVGATPRGSTYAPLPGQEETEPIGSIPQVPATHGYYEANYAIQNDCALSFGESTASAAFKAFAIGQPNGTALFSVNEMTRVAAERVCSAREAVQLMGDLATAHGFYGADGGAGETLMVGDPLEAFVFHVLSDPTGKSGIWVAQRVPDTHVAVIANMFVIREVNTSDAFNFLASSNVHEVALAHGLWDGVGLLDFTKAYSRGEYTHKYYSGRRMWDGLRHFKPSLKLPAEYENLKDEKPARPWGRSLYPWAVEPDAKVSPPSWFATHRSHYEGTAYDTTRGPAAGPYGTPERYQTIGAPDDPGVGSWERTVSIYRTTCTPPCPSAPAPPTRARPGRSHRAPARAPRTQPPPCARALPRGGLLRSLRTGAIPPVPPSTPRPSAPVCAPWRPLPAPSAPHDPLWSRRHVGRPSALQHLRAAPARPHLVSSADCSTENHRDCH